ncbi:MAG TPA: GNAT family N-acetyltransferase [Allosphingosinicella sp.]|jgi:RimJ/RimL family protein N-acetyltransferase
MTVELSPIAGEREFADPALVGEWAGELVKMVGEEQRPPWCSYAVRREGALLGLGGFKGEPGERMEVEIGYLTFKPAEGQGVASETAAALVEIARDAGASLVCAHTLPEENASTGVLRRNGFAFSGPVVDPEDGEVWRWEKRLS